MKFGERVNTWDCCALMQRGVAGQPSPRDPGLEPSWTLSFQRGNEFASIAQSCQSALPGEQDRDIHHNWGVTFSSPGASARLAAGGRLSASLFRRLVPGILLPLAGLLTFCVVNRREQAQLVMSDNDICQARFWPVIWLWHLQDEKNNPS